MSLTADDKQWISGQLAEQRQWMKDELEAMETKLLTAFHQWVSPADLRTRSHAAAIRALDLEVEAHGERLDKLEHPPQS